jgi:hypothetical protein
MRVLNPADRAGSLAFLFALETVNFGGTYARLLSEEGMDLPDGLYLTTALRLKARFERAALTPAAMTRTTPQDCAEVFGFRMDRPHNRAMAEMYARALRQTGEHVEKYFDSDFSILIKNSKPYVESFVQNMRKIPRFDDTYLYPSRSGPDIDVPILKNAQHLAASLSVAALRLGLPKPFDDTEKLTAFPDNKIAHVLWVDGLVRFSDDLSRRIESLTPIPVGSAEEIEIRVAGRHAVRLITEFTNARRTAFHAPLRQIDIDHRIWHASHGPSVLLARRRYADTPCFRTQEMTCHY